MIYQDHVRRQAIQGHLAAMREHLAEMRRLVECSGEVPVTEIPAVDRLCQSLEEKLSALEKAVVP